MKNFITIERMTVIFVLVVVLVLVVFITMSCARKEEENPTPSGYQHIVIIQLTDNSIHTFKANYTKEANGYMYIFKNGRRVELATIPKEQIKIVRHEEEQIR